MIQKCNCRHEFQDSRYGTGNRVHNESRGKNKELVYRCTVCGDEKSSAGGGTKEVKSK